MKALPRVPSTNAQCPMPDASSMWSPCSTAAPCPVCAGTECHLHQSGAVCCTFPDLIAEAAEGDVAPPPGWSAVRAVTKNHRGRPVTVGVLLVRAGTDAGTLDDPDLATARERQEDARAELYKKKNEAKAAKIWETVVETAGSTDHQRVRDYLTARGIPLDRLPRGAVPTELRFSPKSNDFFLAEGEQGQAKRGRWIQSPAMVARMVKLVNGQKGVGRVFGGVHRTFLDPVKPAKRGEMLAITEGPRKGEVVSLGAPKKMLGGGKGRVIVLADRLSSDSGAVVIAEGIETALACMVALADVRGGVPALVGLSAEHLAAVQLPGMIFDVTRERFVHTVIVAADCNTGRIKAEYQAGKALELEALGATPAEAEAIAAMPTGERAASTFAVRLRATYPWVNVVVRPPTPAAASHLFKDGAPVGGGCDWLDVALEHGYEAVTAGLIVGVDLEANREQAISQAARADLIPARVGPAGDADTPGEDDAQQDRGTAGTSASGSSWGGGAGGGGVAGGGGFSIAAPQGGDPWKMPLVEDDTMLRARRFLCDRGVLSADACRFALVRYAEKWWQFDGRGYAEVAEEVLRSRVWDWLQGFSTMKREQRVRVAPTRRMVDDVLSALVTDTTAAARGMPCWLPTTIDAGVPLWGKATAIGAAEGATVDASKGDARSRLVFRNGVLDLARLANQDLPAAERVRLERSTPELFHSTVLPFNLPTDELRRIVDGADLDTIAERLCPNVWRWMADASDADPDWQEQLLLMLGDTLSADRSIEKIFGVVGMQRGGKGIIEDMIVAILGEENVGSLDAFTLDRAFGLAHLIGMRAIVMADAHFDQLRGGAAVERLKAISGQGRIPVEEKFGGTATVRLPGRIWVFSNELPDLKDQSSALARRWLFLPITKSYIGREDPTIKAAVPHEAAGVMLLALYGAMKLAAMERRAISPCLGSRELTEEYVAQSAPVMEFIKECMVYDEREVEAASKSSIDDLYRAYAWWSEHELGRTPLGYQKFAGTMKTSAAPWIVTQPRTDSGKRSRRVDGWVVRDWVLNKMRPAGGGYGHQDGFANRAHRDDGPGLEQLGLPT